MCAWPPMFFARCFMDLTASILLIAVAVKIEPTK